MHSLLLFDVNDREIPLNVIQHIFHTVPDFQDVQHNTPTGTPIEATYVEGDDFTRVRLNAKRKAISISGTSGAAFSAAWILQSHLDMPLRMVDTDYSFDLIVQDFETIEQLQAAIDKARES